MSKQRHLKERIPTDVSASQGAVGPGGNLFAICVKILITAFLGHTCPTIWPLRFLGFCVTEKSCLLSQGNTYSVGNPHTLRFTTEYCSVALEKNLLKQSRIDCCHSHRKIFQSPYMEFEIHNCGLKWESVSWFFTGSI